MMTMQEYQEFCNAAIAGKNDIPPSVDRVQYCAIAFAGEVGETLNLIKKKIRGDNISRARLVEELGDSFYYLARLSSQLDITLDEIAVYNREKLELLYMQYPDSYSKGK